MSSLKQQICDVLLSEQYKVMDGTYDDSDGFDVDDLTYNIETEISFILREETRREEQEQGK